MTPEGAAHSGQKKWMVVKLTKASFRSIARTAREFEDYLASVRGHDSSLAKDNQLRDDKLRHGSDSGGDPAAARKAYDDPGRAIPTRGSGSGGSGSGSVSTRRGKSGSYLTPPVGGNPSARIAASRADASVSHKRSANEDETDDEDEDLSDENLSDD